MFCKTIVFSGHAIRQMSGRDIAKDEVAAVVRSGRIIAEYPEDKPYPSYLILGFSQNRPLHVVIAMDIVNQKGIIVTAYIPDARLWNGDFVARR